MKKDYTKFQLSRSLYSRDYPVHSVEEYKASIEGDIFEEAIYRALKEMYFKAQPSVDFDDLLKEHFDRVNKGLPAEQFFTRYYLSYEEYRYIERKYREAYRFTNEWVDNVDLLIKDAKEGYHSDKYIPSHVDEEGNEHPGYRSYEEKPPIEKTEGKEFADKLIAFLEDRRDYYRFDREESAFSIKLALGVSPNSNAKAVKKYWEEKGVNLEIDPRHLDEDTFWNEEEGFDEEEDE